MEKIVIISDSHGYVDEINRIRLRHDSDIIFHCGDSEHMADHAVLRGITTVEGNCDYPNQFNKDEIVVIAGIRFFITHGHLYNVKQNLTSLSYRAAAIEADVVCFGHSHIVCAEQDKHHVYINPGSIRFPRKPSIPTYVVLEVDGRTIHWALWTVDGVIEDEKTFVLSDT